MNNIFIEFVASKYSLSTKYVNFKDFKIVNNIDNIYINNITGVHTHLNNIGYQIEILFLVDYYKFKKYSEQKNKIYYPLHTYNIGDNANLILNYIKFNLRKEKFKILIND